MAAVPVPSWGIHEDSEGVRNLVQSVTPYGYNYVGLRGQGRLTSKQLREASTHSVNPQLGDRNPPEKFWRMFLHLVQDPLVSAMLPFPHNQTCYFLPESELGDRTTEYLLLLEKLSSPLNSAVKPMWLMNKKSVAKSLSHTNLQPLCFTHAKLEDGPVLVDLYRAAQVSGRTLIVSGADDILLPKFVQRIRLQELLDMKWEELLTLPWEHLGATVIRRHCQHKALNEPLGRKPEHV